MFALFGAKFAVADAACGRHYKFNLRASAAIVAAGLLTACLPASIARAGSHDPADPAARVAAVRYRSTIAPYTSLRPTTPTLWRQRSESVTPQPKSDR
jgi:hypothetical protein